METKKKNLIDLQSRKTELNVNMHRYLYALEKKKTNLTESSYLICTLLIDILRFPIIVEIRELSHEFPEDGCKIIKLSVKLFHGHAHTDYFNYTRKQRKRGGGGGGSSQ